MENPREENKIRCITDITIDRTLEGLLLSRVNAIVWDYNSETGLCNPHEESLKIPHVIPSRMVNKTNSKDKVVREQFGLYKQAMVEDLQEKLEQKDAKLKKAKPGTRDYRKFLREVEALKKVLDNIDSYVFLKVYDLSWNYEVLEITTPKLSSIGTKIALGGKRSLYQTGRYNSSLRHAKLSTDFPFGNTPLEILVNAPGFAIDFETAGWETERLGNSLAEFSTDELREKYREIKETFEESINPKLLPHMTRKTLVHEIEQTTNKHKNERLTTASFIGRDSAYLVTTLNPGKTEISVDDPLTGEKRIVKVILVKDQYDLVDKLNGLYEKEQPFFVYGHNQLKFDYSKAEELTRNFKPGVGKTKVKFRHQIPGGFIKLQTTPGRVDIDGSVWAQNNCSLRNNKLDTVFFHLFHKTSVKTMSYADLSIKTERAEKGSQQDAFEILCYAIQDGLKSYHIGEKIKQEEIEILKAKFLNCLPAAEQTTGARTLTDNFWTNENYTRKHTYPKDLALLVIDNPELDKRVPKRFDDFSMTKHMEKTFSKDKIKKKKPGIYNGKLVAVFPGFDAYLRTIEKNENVKKLLDEAKDSNDPWKKDRIFRLLSAIKEYPIFRSFDPDVREKRFAAEFNLGFSGKELEETRSLLEDNLSIISNLLSESLINQYQHYLVLEENTELPDYEWILEIGKGKFLSGPKNTFAAMINNELFLMGIADYKSNQGERCRFEKNFYEFFLEKILKGDLRCALEYVAEQCRIFANNDISQEELEFVRTARKDDTDYSVAANQSFVKELKKQRAKKGDEVRYQKSQQELSSKFFGIEKQVLEQQSLFGDYSFKPQEGTISSITSWAFNFPRNHRGYFLLEDLFLGKTEPKDIETILGYVSPKPI